MHCGGEQILINISVEDPMTSTFLIVILYFKFRRRQDGQKSNFTDAEIVI